jgi:hypothetical protein
VSPTPLAQDLDTRTQIHDLVVRFYREVVFDDLLGPVFADVAEVDWSVHIPKLIATGVGFSWDIPATTGSSSALTGMCTSSSLFRMSTSIVGTDCSSRP